MDQDYSVLITVKKPRSVELTSRHEQRIACAFLQNYKKKGETASLYHVRSLLSVILKFRINEIGDINTVYIID